jgi:hypothetical protein
VYQSERQHPVKSSWTLAISKRAMLWRYGGSPSRIIPLSPRRVGGEWDARRRLVPGNEVNAGLVAGGGRHVVHTLMARIVLAPHGLSGLRGPVCAPNGASRSCPDGACPSISRVLLGAGASSAGQLSPAACSEPPPQVFGARSGLRRANMAHCGGD